jgi:hypothetical protein
VTCPDARSGEVTLRLTPDLLPGREQRAASVSQGICHRHRWSRLDRSSDESGFGQLNEAVRQTESLMPGPPELSLGSPPARCLASEQHPRCNACPAGRRHASAATQSVPGAVGTVPWATMERRVRTCVYTQDRSSQLRGGRVNGGDTRSYGLV